LGCRKGTWGVVELQDEINESEKHFGERLAVENGERGGEGVKRNEGKVDGSDGDLAVRRGGGTGDEWRRVHEQSEADRACQCCSGGGEKEGERLAG
jgi:hypothetical protein